MDKIHITGNAGAGKSTLAREVGALLDLPVFGLDRIVWQPGWVKSPREAIAKQEQALISRPNWIIEGISHTVSAAADAVIFLDVSRRTSFVRCAKRNYKFLFKGRPELPENCPEILIIPQLLKIIWNFKTRVRPILLEDARKRPNYFVVRSPKDQEQAISALVSSTR